jgi:anti-sigma regulatory factor (Ser/Thr protein kinase)
VSTRRSTFISPSKEVIAFTGLRSCCGLSRVTTKLGVIWKSGIEVVTAADVLDVVLEPDARAAARARLLLGKVADSKPSGVVETAQLLVSELVANAIRYSQGQIGLRALVTDRGTLRVEVSDDNPTVPHVVNPPPSVEQDNGRGMRIVDALASSWGSHSRADPDGKTVWFEL